MDPPRASYRPCSGQSSVVRAEDAHCRSQSALVSQATRCRQRVALHIELIFPEDLSVSALEADDAPARFHPSWMCSGDRDGRPESPESSVRRKAPSKPDSARRESISQAGPSPGRHHSFPVRANPANRPQTRSAGRKGNSRSKLEESIKSEISMVQTWHSRYILGDIAAKNRYIRPFHDCSWVDAARSKATPSAWQSSNHFAHQILEIFGFSELRPGLGAVARAGHLRRAEQEDRPHTSDSRVPLRKRPALPDCGPSASRRWR